MFVHMNTHGHKRVPDTHNTAQTAQTACLRLQWIAFKGKLLSNSQTLAGSGVVDGAELHLVVSESELAVHTGVICDVSGMHPILGNRYHKMGEDYDLCETEFDKLTEADRALYEGIPAPRADPMSFVHVGMHLSVDCTGANGQTHGCVRPSPARDCVRTCACPRDMDGRYVVRQNEITLSHAQHVPASAATRRISSV